MANAIKELRPVGVLFATLCLAALMTLTVQAAELPDFSPLVEQYSNAVVNVSSVTKAPRNAALPFQGQGPYGELPEEAQEFFRHFFGAPPQGGPMQKRASTGSGFIISSDGYVLTNNHVIDGADEITVRLRDRREIEAKVVGTDPGTDLALLKIDGKDLPVVKLGNSDRLKVGEWVLAIGSPFGFDYSVSAGIISALNRSLPNEQNQNYVPFIQTDVAINPGNSGGPLFNMDGEVIGINSMIYTRSGGFMGLSFAIPISVAMDVVGQIKEKGHVLRGWLGVSIQEVNRDLAESFGLERPAGALVAAVVPDSPAAKGGLQAGDIILKVDGTAIEFSADLPHLIGRKRPGSTAALEVVRNGKPLDLKVKVGELPSEPEKLAQQGGGGAQPQNRLGILVSDLTAEQLRELELPHGIVIEEVVDGVGAAIGLRPGMVITAIANKPVKSAAEFNLIVKSLPANRLIAMRVLRDGVPLFVTFKLPK
jgi:serine protease Do